LRDSLYIVIKNKCEGNENHLLYRHKPY